MARYPILKIYENKKVLLRERKRHTARCVANTRYVVLTGYPPWGGNRSGTPPGGSGYPLPPRGYLVRSPGGVSGYPPRGYLVRYPPGGSGYPPPGGYPVRYPPGGSGYPLGGPGTPQGVWVPPGGYLVRYPRGGPGTPPRGGTRSGTPPGGYPDPPSPPVDRQTLVKTVPSRRTTYAGGKNCYQM